MFRFNPRKLARLRRNESGATAIEFALIAPALIALLMGVVQIAIIFFFEQALQTVGEKAARNLMTGQAQKAGMTQTQFQQQICSYASSLFQCGNLMVDVRSASSFSAVTTTFPAVTYNGQGQPTTAWNYNPGGPGSIVIVRIMYNWPVINGPLGLSLANQSNGTYLMVATAVFKNEPYQ